MYLFSDTAGVNIKSIFNKTSFPAYLHNVFWVTFWYKDHEDDQTRGSVCQKAASGLPTGVADLKNIFDRDPDPDLALDLDNCLGLNYFFDYFAWIRIMNWYGSEPEVPYF